MVGSTALTSASGMVVCAVADSQVVIAAATIMKRAVKNFIAGQISETQFRRGLSLQYAGEEVEHYSRARQSGVPSLRLAVRLPAAAHKATSPNPASATSVADRCVNCEPARTRFGSSSISRKAWPEPDFAESRRVREVVMS